MVLKIRSANETDLDQITRIYNHYVVNTPVSFDLEAFSVAARRTWFAHYAPEGRYRLVVAEDDGQVVGYASTSPFRPKAAYETSVETTVYVAPEHLGKGVGTHLYAFLFAAIVGEDLHRAYAGITLPNQASIALHRNFGFEATATFREVGRKFGKYWDVAWLVKPLP